jgi:ATP phosphoribosyltransferase
MPYQPLRLDVLGRISERALTAGLPGSMDAASHRPLRVATKYVETARAYFSRLGRQVEIIKLYGSMELAPIVGLADVIVDLVDTGNTLRANGLEAFDVIEDISARLVVNKAAQKMKHAEISELLDLFEPMEHAS